MKDYRALAEQFIREYSKRNRLAPFEKFEQVVIRMFAEWLSQHETNQTQEREDVQNAQR